MDTTNNAAVTDNLKIWWDAKLFPGKEYCSLQDNGALTVAPFPEKIVSTLNVHTGDAVIQSLLDKFKDLLHKVAELEKEWQETEDKLKLSSKISRLKEHLSGAHAIGDFKALLDQLNHWEADVTARIEENYKAKLSLVTTAEALAVENNNWKDVTQKLRDIADSWKLLGFVDKKRNEALWDRLEAVRNKFFEQKRVHQDDVEKDMLQNLDLKMEIVEKAEALAASENWKETTEAMKQLLAEWKNTGRTIPEKNEALWQRFITASNAFFDRKKQHSDRIQVEQEANYALKLAIVEKAELIKDSTDWTITAQAFNQLMADWKAIGHVPAEHSTVLWQRFDAAKDVFYQAKRSQADAYKTMLEDNYAAKMALIERAELIKNSNNWRETSDEMNQLFEQWKQIGHVGKEHSEVLWERFLQARKHFFNRKDEDRERRKQHFEKVKEDRVQQTKNFLDTLIRESTEETAQIAEFKENLANTGDGPKADEIRTHLNNLIAEFERNIRNREPKIADLKAQVQQLEAQDKQQAADKG